MDRLSYIELKAMLLVDDKSRKKIRTTLSDLEGYGVKLLYSLRDITTDMIKRYDKLVVLEDYLLEKDSISELQLKLECTDLELFYIGTDEARLNLMSEYGKVAKMNINTLGYEQLYGFIMEDENVLNRYIIKEEDTSQVEFCNDIMFSPDYDMKVKRLASSLLTMRDVNDTLKEKMTHYKNLYLERGMILDNYKEDLDKILATYANVLKEVADLNRSTTEYEAILSKEVYEKVLCNRYKTRPIVVYMKEYQELIHLNSFLETLSYALRIQAKVPVKVLRLYDKSCVRRLQTVPASYKILGNSYSISDVLTQDYLVKYGDYREVLNLLLTNKISCGVLIVVDCKSYTKSTVSGADLVYNICRNRNHLRAFGLKKENTIVNGYDYEDGLVWADYSTDEDFRNESTRFQFLSSKSIITEIYGDIIDRIQNAI